VVKGWVIRHRAADLTAGWQATQVAGPAISSEHDGCDNGFNDEAAPVGGVVAVV
jgi:hypothetical protein